MEHDGKLSNHGLNTARVAGSPSYDPDIQRSSNPRGTFQLQTFGPALFSITGTPDGCMRNGSNLGLGPRAKAALHLTDGLSVPYTSSTLTCAQNNC